MFSVLAASQQSTLNPLSTYVELGRMPSALHPMFTVWIHNWEELIIAMEQLPSSIRLGSLNKLRPIAAEVSYLFFLSHCARFHTAHTRGSPIFQQWCITDHRRIWERAECHVEGVTPLPPLSLLSHFNSFLPPPPPSLTLYQGWGLGPLVCLSLSLSLYSHWFTPTVQRCVKCTDWRL